MENLNTKPKKIHQGRNIKKIRELKNMKQEYLAQKMKTTQQYISNLEQKEIIDDEILDRVANILDIPVNTIKNMNDDFPVNYYNNTFHDNATVNGAISSSENTTNVNVVDKFIEIFKKYTDDIKDLCEKHISLYKNILNEKNEIIKEKNEIIKEKNEIIKEKNEMIEKINK